MPGPKEELEKARDELERERHRALLLVLQKMAEQASSLEVKLVAAIAALSAATHAKAAAEQERAQLEKDRPIRQLVTAFLAADWRGKLIFLSPLIVCTLLLYSLVVGVSPATVAGDLLSTAKICATGAPHGSLPPPSDGPSNAPEEPRAVLKPE